MTEDELYELYHEINKLKDNISDYRKKKDIEKSFWRGYVTAINTTGEILLDKISRREK